ncbi:MAG: hypothetical protein HOV68_29545 [Streptomycetaceae bacterium]|nr:hypothetical protein [Streptomycetaceae bacterium]
MDSVTRPVGHLPPSVYWRRRAIVLVGLAVLIALVAWACTAGGGGGDDKKNAGAESPAPSGSSGPPGAIGPGATNPAPGTDPGQPPGTTGGTGTNPGANAGSGPGGTGGGTAPGAATGGTVPGGANAGATGAGTNGGTNGQAPAGQPSTSTGGGTNVGGMLGCTYPGNAQLILTGDRPQDSRYRYGEQVKLTLEIRNTGTETCAVDMAQRSASVEITSGNDHIWSPADCASGQPEITQIQPGKSVTRTWTWSWTRSDPGRCSGQAPNLATPPPGALFTANGKVAGMQWASNPYKWTVAQ